MKTINIDSADIVSITFDGSNNELYKRFVEEFQESDLPKNSTLLIQAEKIKKESLNRIVSFVSDLYELVILQEECSQDDTKTKNVITGKVLYVNPAMI